MSMSGDPVRGVHCPRCGLETVTYNGNYFCDDPGCGWAMADYRKGKKADQNREIIRTYLVQRRTEAQAAGRTEEAERMDFYLTTEN